MYMYMYMYVVTMISLLDYIHVSINYQHTLFYSGQCEKHFPNGTKEITFPDQTLKYVHPSGEEETHFPDGTLQKTLPHGDMTLFYANGQKEISTPRSLRYMYNNNYASHQFNCII